MAKAYPAPSTPSASATGTAALQCLARHGRLLVYGTLANEPIAIDPRVLLVGQKKVEGFWLSEWARERNVLTMLGLFKRIGKLIHGGTLATEIGETFPLDRIQEAGVLASQPGNRQGKVLLRIATAEK